MNMTQSGPSGSVWEERAKKLVDSMTLEEKISQMLYHSPAIERLGIKAYCWWNEALHGVAGAGTATVFPQAINLAAMFDEQAVERIADAIASEGRAKYHAFQQKGDHDTYKGLTFWSPNVNIFRDPRWGRGQETFGEDPYLTAQNGKAFVRGLQGSDPVYWKASACAKHFAAHSGPEAQRHCFNAEVTPKDLRETYLYAFEALVRETDVSGVMGAYNAVNGEPCCASPTLLQRILREEWGFDGYVTSDCWAIKDIHLGHQATRNATESVVAAVKSGCDLNCGNLYGRLLVAVRSGLITEEEINRSVQRLMVVRLRLGMLDDPETVPYARIPYSVVACPEHKAMALDAAEKSMVLLKNEQNLLPLDPGKIRRIAVIGPNADSRTALTGNYHGTPSFCSTVLDGIRKYLEPFGTDVRYAAGSHLFADRVEKRAFANDRIAEAVIEAERADVVVLCLGLDETVEGEEGDAVNSFICGDKSDLLLPKPQRLLLEQVLAAGTPVIGVLMAGSAIDMDDPRLTAWIYAGYPGEQGGDALARILFGEVSPSGRLPVTFYRGHEPLPPFEDYSMHGRTYRYFQGTPLYPFGYGLSYTRFSYSGLAPANTGDAVTVRVKNTGQRRGREIVQLYVAPPATLPDMPKWSLKAFRAVELDPGEEMSVRLALSDEAFTLFDLSGNRFLSDGTYTLYAGGGQPEEGTPSLPVRWQNGQIRLD